MTRPEESYHVAVRRDRVRRGFGTLREYLHSMKQERPQPPSAPIDWSKPPSLSPELRHKLGLPDERQETVE